MQIEFDPADLKPEFQRDGEGHEYYEHHLKAVALWHPEPKPPITCHRVPLGEPDE